MLAGSMRAPALRSLHAAVSLVIALAAWIPCVVARLRSEDDGATAPACHRYRGTINGGPLLGSIETNSSIECEQACRTTAGCYAFVYMPFNSVKQATGRLSPTVRSHTDQASCTVYNHSNIGNGRNLEGTPTQELTVDACCALCSSNPMCESWTWACTSWPCPTGKSQPCWLHPFGSQPATPTHAPTWVSGTQTAHQRPNITGGHCELLAPLPQNSGHSDQWTGPGVNSGTGATSGLCGLDDAQFDNPLQLLNSTNDATGVPLGGIGVGFLDYAPDGQIKRVAINNAHEDGVLTDTHDGTFLALTTLSETGASTARVLQRTQIGGAAGAAGLSDLRGSATKFTGLFPTAELDVDGGAIRISAWSSLVPHQIENSSLPLVYFDVSVKNTQSTQVVVSTAISWQDVISRNIFDATNAQLDLCYPNNTGPATCALDVNQLMSCIGGWGLESCELNGRTRCRDMARVPTSALPLTIGKSLAGFEQRASAGQLFPNKLTMQQYNNRVAVLVEKEDGDEVSLLTSYIPSQNSSDSNAVAAWKEWATSGRFPSSNSFARDHSEAEPLYIAPSGPEAASAVALRTPLAPGASRTIRFVVVWHAQEVSAAGRTDNRTVCGTTDHNRMYHNRFAGPKGLESLVSYATAPAVRSALRAGTIEWHLPVLTSTMPSFLQFKLINSAYTMYTNALLNQAGHFSAMEGGMGGLAGTQDQRIAAHLFYFKFFTSQDTLELAQFGAAQVIRLCLSLSDSLRAAVSAVWRCAGHHLSGHPTLAARDMYSVQRTARCHHAFRREYLRQHHRPHHRFHRHCQRRVRG